jgi:hypothetical protein
MTSPVRVYKDGTPCIFDEKMGGKPKCINT